jgi:hypothetical protein
MKNVKNGLLILGMFLLVGSVTSCKAIKKAKAKRCKCPTFGMEDQQPDKAKKDEDVEIALEINERISE